MKREKKEKTRKASTSSSITSDSDSRKESVPIEPSPKKHKSSKQKNESAKETQSGISVRLHNAEMLSKYRNKNPHINIENPKYSSNFSPSEINDDDDVWLFEVPNNVDVSELVGKSVKLGSKSCFIKTENNPIECVSERYDDPEQNIKSLICQKSNSQLKIKNVRPVGRVMLRTNVTKTLAEAPIEFDERAFSKNVAYPANLKVRHPLHGFQFEDSVNLSATIKHRLSSAQQVSSMATTRSRIKQEPVDDRIKSEVSPKKSKKRKADTHDDSIVIEHKKSKKTIKAENTNDDLAWISQL